jgi:DNA-binding response OmpR family regulator
MGKVDEKKVLIIEDDPNTASLVALYLEREGFLPLKTDNGETGLKMAEQHRPIMVILDLMLPKMDGWEVCRHLREKSNVPIIMLTARGDEIDRVSGLTLGADDYISKPFSPRELVARVKAVLRRYVSKERRATQVLSHGDLRLDLGKRRLKINDRPISLTPHEFTLLKTLMSAPGRIYSRQELLDRIYPKGEAVVIDRVVDVHIGKLRQKIEPNPAEPQFILTARGLGYRFAD